MAITLRWGWGKAPHRPHSSPSRGRRASRAVPPFSYPSESVNRPLVLFLPADVHHALPHRPLYLAAMRAILYPRLQYNMGFYFKYLVPPTFLPVLPPLRSFTLVQKYDA